MLQDLERTAKNLALFTIVYNLIEGIVSIGFGIAEDSVSLAGFGGDSLIEVGSAVIVLWRLKGEVSRERTATLLIGALFVLLAALTIFSAGIQLLEGNRPLTTLPGIVISSVSLSFMFFLWRAKVKVAYALDSKTLMQDAQCSLACIKLSAVLFVGSLLFWISPDFYFADAVAAIVLGVLIGIEGISAIRAARSEKFTGSCCGGC